MTFADPDWNRALVGLVLASAGLALAPFTLACVRRIDPSRTVFFARWGFSQVAVVTLVWLGSTLLAGEVAARFRGEHGLLADMWASLASMLPPSLVVLAIAQRRDPKGIVCLGLAPEGSVRAVLVGLIAYLAALPVLLGLGILWPWLYERLGGEFAPQRALLEIPSLTGGSLAAALVVAIALQPLFEELLFRAFLQPLLVQNLGDRGGVFLTSFVFALLHGGSAFLPILGLSLLLGMLMLRTQRLAAVWLVHALHNGLVLSLMLHAPRVRELLEVPAVPALLP